MFQLVVRYHVPKSQFKSAASSEAVFSGKAEARAEVRRQPKCDCLNSENIGVSLTSDWGIVRRCEISAQASMDAEMSENIFSFYLRFISMHGYMHAINIKKCSLKLFNLKQKYLQHKILDIYALVINSYVGTTLIDVTGVLRTTTEMG